jgi:L-fuconolactonase
MWGSDWPMTLLTAGYTGTWEVMSTLISELTAPEQEQVLSATATRVYGLRAPLETAC